MSHLIILDLKTAKESFLTAKFQDTLDMINDSSLKRSLMLNKDNGAGAWLTALPLKDHGYCLNKQEFCDAICLRYSWSIPNTPHFCGCGSKNGIDHNLICKKGRLCVHVAQCPQGP